MPQRSAHFTRPGERPEETNDVSTPVFATSVLALGTIRVPGFGGH